MSSAQRATRANSFRAHKRLARAAERSARIDVLVTHARDGWRKRARLENVGLGGACLALPEKLAPGDAVTVSMSTPALWDPLVVRARVAWADAAGRFGVAFEHRSALQVFALFELIATLAQA